MVIGLQSILGSALDSIRRARGEEGGGVRDGARTFGDFDRFLLNEGIDHQELLGQAAIIASRSGTERRRRDGLTFSVACRHGAPMVYTESSSVTWELDPATVHVAVKAANLAMELVHDLSLLYGIELFQTLGLRNLSSFVGEVLARQVGVRVPDRFRKNPNQDGYPDLCALTPEGRRYIEKHSDRNGVLPNKEFWSPYPFGGIEVKATCGNTPAAKTVRKPLIGETRCPILVSAEWKAHHQETKILLGAFWDFVDGLPTILAVFFRNDLDTRTGSDNRDWGAIIHPKEGGGRTTSVSIMRHGPRIDEGVRKMGQGWVVLPQDPDLLPVIRRVFGLDA